MATGLTVKSIDLDDIFKTRTSTARANVGILVSSADIATRYEPASKGQSDQIDYDTGYSSSGTDLRYLFRKKNYIESVNFQIRSFDASRSSSGWGNHKNDNNGFMVVAMDPNSLIKQNGNINIQVYYVASRAILVTPARGLFGKAVYRYEEYLAGIDTYNTYKFRVNAEWDNGSTHSIVIVDGNDPTARNYRIDGVYTGDDKDNRYFLYNYTNNTATALGSFTGKRNDPFNGFNPFPA